MTLNIGLSDIFADSGIVGALTCRVEGQKAALEEVLFSCRILRRRIEDIAFRMLLEKLKATGVETLAILSQASAKNLPALSWLQYYCGLPARDISVSALLEKAENLAKNHPAKVETAS